MDNYNKAKVYSYKAIANSYFGFFPSLPKQGTYMRDNIV